MASQDNKATRLTFALATVALGFQTRQFLDVDLRAHAGFLARVEKRFHLLFDIPKVWSLVVFLHGRPPSV